MGDGNNQGRTFSDPTKSLRTCIESRDRWKHAVETISARIGSAHAVAIAMIDDLMVEQRKPDLDENVALIIKAQIDALETWVHYFESGIRTECLPLGSCACHAYMFQQT